MRQIKNSKDEKRAKLQNGKINWYCIETMENRERYRRFRW